MSAIAEQMRRGLARAILRESRQLRATDRRLGMIHENNLVHQRNNASGGISRSARCTAADNRDSISAPGGNCHQIIRTAAGADARGLSAGSNLPAIYDVCNSVNPLSGGILLGDLRAYQAFGRRSCETWLLPSQVENHFLLRKNLGAVLAVLDTQNSTAALGNVKAAAARVQADEKDADQIPMALNCPFDLLRTFKFRNRMSKVVTRSECNGISLTTVTGFAREVSASVDGENIFSYNMHFTNQSDRPVRILAHNVMFRNRMGRELKSEYAEGVNKAMPLIKPGEHYVCGSTVAFPADVENPAVSGSFELAVEDEPRSEAFEKLNLAQKAEQLKSEAMMQNTIRSFRLKMPETRFQTDVQCDLQPLSEKLKPRRYSVEPVPVVLQV